jgi:hypothetical protein
MYRNTNVNLNQLHITHCSIKQTICTMLFKFRTKSTGKTKKDENKTQYQFLLKEKKGAKTSTPNTITTKTEKESIPLPFPEKKNSLKKITRSMTH